MQPAWQPTCVGLFLRTPREEMDMTPEQQADEMCAELRLDDEDRAAVLAALVQTWNDAMDAAANICDVYGEGGGVPYVVGATDCCAFKIRTLKRPQ